MFIILVSKGLIEKKGEFWSLTNLGVDAGGKFKTSAQYGKYITWPENIDLKLDKNTEKKVFLTTTAIGKKYNISAKKMNFILSELGWVYKVMKGWKTTPQGIQHGGLQDEDKRTGIPYVRWPEMILKSNILNNTIKDIQGEKAPSSDPVNTQDNDFREKFKVEHRATDGHFVRSKAEMLIDNWLYMAEIVHSYERKLPIEEDVYSDFYIPTGKVYIEY
ncbi:hypothetical protein [Desulfotalea psychrophila]|uniref:Uncharacterized protein n=1 Tax=Desulfotalea psychrophila (strain LSv54 / DSM 12343) TaxID=177439 RepID=Q6AQJ1_DESPS|nr:hypothetical protein [Desulfotalea psychrophila]CAG35382.1 conserved hypothetical protein [Desulfotalea psychrophila LSv54]